MPQSPPQSEQGETHDRTRLARFEQVSDGLALHSSQRSLWVLKLQGNKQAIKYMKRIAELRELIKLEAGLKDKNI
jgi:hypothetical protein